MTGEAPSADHSHPSHRASSFLVRCRRERETYTNIEPQTINWKGGQQPSEKGGRTDEKYTPHAVQADLKAVPVGLARA